MLIGNRKFTTLGGVHVKGNGEIGDKSGVIALESVEEIQATSGYTFLGSKKGKLTVVENGVERPVGGTENVEVVTETNVITAAESGKVFILDDATEFVSTLPEPAAGLKYTFIVGAAPAGASYTVVTNGSANIIAGTVHSSTGGNASSDQDGDTITFADGVAVKGDRAEVVSDGTSWYAVCHCDADAGITITGA